MPGTTTTDTAAARLERARRLAWAGIGVPLAADLLGIALNAAGAPMTVWAALALYVAGGVCAVGAQRVLAGCGELDPPKRRRIERLVVWAVALAAVHILLLAWADLTGRAYLGGRT